MSDRPIIFSAPMVRALLDGRKSQTRRILTATNTLFDGGKWPNYMHDDQFHWERGWVDEGPSPAGNPGPYLKIPVTNIEFLAAGTEETVHRIYPRIQPQDRLYVREGHVICEACGYIDPTVDANSAGVGDRHCCRSCDAMLPKRARPSIHMPRSGSRLTLTVTDVRVQRLQDISEADAVAEGCVMDGTMPAEVPHKSGIGEVGWDCARDWYADLWEDLHGPEAWEANPWVVAYSFTVERRNIDEKGGA